MPPEGLAPPKVRSLQGRAAAAQRWNRPDQDEIRRDYAAEKIAEYVRQAVSAAPPLTADQQARIAALLRPGAPS